MPHTFSLPEEYRQHVPPPLPLSVEVPRPLDSADARAILRNTDGLMKISEGLFRLGVDRGASPADRAGTLDAANAIARFANDVAEDVGRALGGEEPEGGGRRLRAV